MIIMGFTISLLLFSILVTLVSFTIIKRIWYFQLFRNLGIPGPPPNIVWGNMNEIRSRDTTPMEVMSRWEALYGETYGYFVGRKPTLVLRDPEALREVLINNSKTFLDRPDMIINVAPLPNTLVGLTGTRWKEVRGMLSPTFSSAKVKQIFPFLTLKTDITLAVLNKKGEEGVDLDAYKLFQGLTCDVISGCALAMKVNSQLDENDKFLTTIKGFLGNAYSPFVKIALCFPIIATFAEWGLKTFGYSHEMTQMIMDSVKKAIEVRRSQNNILKQKQQQQLYHQQTEQEECQSSSDSLNNSHHVHQDVLQSMLNADESNQTGNVTPLTDEEIVANSWVFILGGFETTAASLTFTSYLLSQDQTVQRKLFEEIETFFGVDEVPTYDQLNEMTYLDQVLCESLRLYPPVVSFVIRRVHEHVKIGLYDIPAGMNVQIPIWQIHHDPNLWPEPYKFNPDRFSTSAKKSYLQHSMSWLPFGAGPRRCIGERFALFEIKFAIARIIRRFRILPTDESEAKVKLIVPTVSLVPKNGIPLRFESRV